MSHRPIASLFVLAVCGSAAACTLDPAGTGQGASEEPPAATPSATPEALATAPAPARTVQIAEVDTSAAIAGSVAGLQGEGLKIRINDQTVGLGSNGGFAIDGLTRGKTFTASIASEPIGPWQVCGISHNQGVVGTSPELKIVCATKKFSVGGTVQGITGGLLVLRRRDDDAVGIATDGKFEFPTKMLSGTQYDVVVHQQPEGQFCTLDGEGSVQGEDVSLRVTCVPS